MERSQSLRCPHCGQPLPRISIWASIPAKGKPNYHCEACGADAWFPMATRVTAMVAMALIIIAGCTLVFRLKDIETQSPVLMACVFLLALGAVLTGAMWSAGWICSRSSVLVRSNFGSH